MSFAQDYGAKSVEELRKMLLQAREDLRKARFSLASHQLKNTAEIRTLRVRVAHVLTSLGLRS